MFGLWEKCIPDPLISAVNEMIEISYTLRCFGEYNCADSLCRRRSCKCDLQRTKNSGWRGQWAASASVLIFILAPVSLATAQQAVVRDLCASARWISAPSTPAAIAPTPALNAVEPNPRSVPPTPAPDSAEPDVEPISVESIPAPISVDPREIAKINRCVNPSPIGVRYNPELTAKVRRQYEDDLVNAKDATKEKVVSNVILSARVDVTTPPSTSYDATGSK